MPSISEPLRSCLCRRVGKVDDQFQHPNQSSAAKHKAASLCCFEGTQNPLQCVLRVAWLGGRLHQKPTRALHPFGGVPAVCSRANTGVIQTRGARVDIGNLSVPIRLAAQTIGIRAEGRRESRETAGPRARLARDRVRLLRRRSNRTFSSERKGWKMPAALEPPPT